MIQADMLMRVRAQLAIDLNCAPEDFDTPGILLFEAADHPDRRPFPRGERHFEMITMGGDNAIVSASAVLLPRVRAWLDGLRRDDAFALPFVQGQALYFLPEAGYIPSLPVPAGVTLEWVDRDGIPPLYEIPGFYNALGYDINHPRPDVLALLARTGGGIVGLAGASIDAREMWQVGIDVLPGFRGRGLAAVLVARLTAEIMSRGKVPYYGTATSNLASQRVAYRAGYQVAWMCAYRAVFDGETTRPTG